MPATTSPRRLTLAVALLTPFLTWVGGKAAGPARCDGLRTMMRLELAGSAEDARLVLGEWGVASGLGPEALVGEVRKALWFDMAFIPLYVAALWLACRAVGAAAKAGSLLWWAARSIAPLPFVAAALDYVENAALLRVLSGSAGRDWASIARLCALPKFAIVIATFLFVLVAVGLLVAHRLTRAPATWRLPLLLGVSLGNWFLSYPILAGTAVLLLGVVWRVLLVSLGIPDLFWHEARLPQLMAGVGAGLLIADLGFVGFLIDAPQPWTLRLAQLPGFRKLQDQTVRALAPYLVLTSGVLAAVALGSVLVADVPARWCLPSGLLLAAGGYSVFVIWIWQGTRVSFKLLGALPPFLLDAIRTARGNQGVGGPGLDGLALVFMALRSVLLGGIVLSAAIGGADWTVPPAFGICIALGGLAAFYGSVAFFFPSRRFGLVAALALLWVAVNGFAGPRHRIRELAYPPVRPAPSDVHHVAREASGLMDDDAVLEGWFQTRGSRGPLVVVAADGGGVRAATWVMTVLTGLEQEIPAFPEQVRLVSGASGGMLAAAYYVASLQDPASGPHRHRNGRGQPLRPEDLRARVGQDSLTPLSKRLFLHDLVPGLSHLGHDRGDAIQQAWEEQAEGVLSVRMRDLGPGERAGWRPSLVFAPMIVEDGRRLLISNLDLDGLATEATPQRNLSRGALQLGRMFADAGELRLATAVRMNATFPYVMPSLELPTSPSLRTVDAGYYDEHGVDLAARWLLSHADFIKARVGRVILIEIPDSLASVAKSGPCGEPRPWFRSGSSGLTTPVEAILSGRDAVSAYGNDELIEVLAGALNSADAPERFLSVAFEPPYAVKACAGCEQAEEAVPLSWYIKSKDARKLCEGMGSAENSRKLAALKQWWSR